MTDAAVPGGAGTRLAGQTAWATAGRLAAAAGGFLAATAAARVLSSADFGAFLLALSIATVGGGIARLGLDRAVVRLVADREAAGDPVGTAATVRTTVVLAVVAGAAFAAALAGPPGHWLAADVLRSDGLDGVMASVAVWTVAESLRRVLSEAFRGLGDIRSATVLGDGPRAVLLAVAVASLPLVADDPSLGLVVHTATGTCVLSGVVAALALRRRMREGAAPPGARRTGSGAILRISLPMLGVSLGGMIVGQGDLWVVGRFLGEDAVATYGAALRVGTLLLVPLLVINAVVPPIVVRMHARGEMAELERLLRAYTSLATVPVVVATLVVVVAGEPLLELLFGGFARDGAGVLLVLAVSQVVAVSTGSCGITLLMTGHERSVAVATAASSALLLVGTGAVAAGGGTLTQVALASGASTVVLNVGLVVYAHRALGIWTHATISRAAIEQLRHVDIGA